MSLSKTATTGLTPRTDLTRRRVLEAAERLLRNGGAAFSMRELATEAGVSFATPFNLFGSKPAIMHALSAQRIDAMAERFGHAKPTGDAADRVLSAVEIAAEVMLAEPAVNRAVIGTLGAPGPEPGTAYLRSRALWARALGDGSGFEADVVGLALSVLPDHLAMAFRGVLSFWTAGEVGDDEFVPRAHAAAAALLLGFLVAERREAILVNLVPPGRQGGHAEAGGPCQS